ncbi:MAG: hypothetical protein EXS13_04865 [Planctomycetes bacterium]|nr:hypothetical protein [Planctomycetota bacterium]
MDDAFFTQIREYTGFGPADEALLHSLLPALPAVLDELVEDFYGAILRDQDAKRVLSDATQFARLKRSLREWATTMLAGPHDARWFELRSRIGQRHVEVGLPQRFVPLAIARIRPILTRLTFASVKGDSARLERMLEALHKILDLELSIMLESYLALHNARVRQAERLGTLGQLAASVSHELKNPLGGINTSLHLLKREIAPDGGALPAGVATHLDRIGRGSRQAARLASQLLDFARGKRPVERTFALQSMLDESLAMVEEREGVVVESRCEPADATAYADPEQLAQALANLVRNATQAIRESGVGGRGPHRGARAPRSARCRAGGRRRRAWHRRRAPRAHLRSALHHPSDWHRTWPRDRP